LNNLIKKNCVEIKKIKGNISKIIEGALIKDKYIGKIMFVFVSLKNSISLSIFKINTKLNMIKKILIKDFKNV
tara:strand:+ start:938 stop:1156 length:219 start_codon:yes stop_codon:yes gene_type:complete